MQSEILKPVAVLIAWTIIVLVWLILKRIPAMKAAGIDLNKMVGGKGTDADGVLRIAHSLVQITFNRVRYRFLLFALSTLCLLALTVHALIGVFALHG